MTDQPEPALSMISGDVSRLQHRRPETAPDAMRACVEKIRQEAFRIPPPNPHTPEIVGWCIWLENALSAPVPPADGKCSDCGKNLNDDDEPHQLDCEYRSPSPAVVAEPDDDWEARSERSYIDNTKAKFYAVLSRSIPSDMIDSIWQDLKEAGVVT